MSTVTVQQVVASFFAATRDMDVEAWLSTFAEDAVGYDPVGAKPLQGHSDLRQFMQGLMDTFQSIGLTEDFVTVIGNEAAIKWTGRGVGKNGRSVTFEGIDIIKVNEGMRIQTLSAYWDTAALTAQLQG